MAERLLDATTGVHQAAALVGNGHRRSLASGKMRFELIGEMMDIDHRRFDIGSCQRVQAVIDQRLAAHFHQWFRCLVGNRLHPHAEPGGEHHALPDGRSTCLIAIVEFCFMLRHVGFSTLVLSPQFRGLDVVSLVYGCTFHHFLCHGRDNRFSLMRSRFCRTSPQTIAGNLQGPGGQNCEPSSPASGVDGEDSRACRRVRPGERKCQGSWSSVGPP